MSRQKRQQLLNARIKSMKLSASERVVLRWLVEGCDIYGLYGYPHHELSGCPSGMQRSTLLRTLRQLKKKGCIGLEMWTESWTCFNFTLFPDLATDKAREFAKGVGVYDEQSTGK